MRHLRSHAITRAKQRYGLLLSRKDIEEVNRMIRNGEAEFIQRESRTRTRWAVTFRGLRMVAIYNSDHNCVATFLPEEADAKPAQVQVLPSEN